MASERAPRAGRGAGAAGDVVRNEPRRNRSASRCLPSCRERDCGSAVTAPHLARQMAPRKGISGAVGYMAGISGALRHLATARGVRGRDGLRARPFGRRAMASPFGAAPPARNRPAAAGGGLCPDRSASSAGTRSISPTSPADRSVASGSSSTPGAERSSSGSSRGRGGFAPEGGEFSEPPPLGPPPARDFREGNYGYGPGPGYGPEDAAAEGQGRGRGPPRRPARAGSPNRRRRPRNPPNAAERGDPAVRRGACAGRAGRASGTAASPPANPTVSEPAKAEPSPPNAASEPGRRRLSRRPRPLRLRRPRRRTAPPEPAAGSLASRREAGEKKVNDLPVNPLD